MAFPIVMPSLGMYTAEGTLVAWLRPAGSPVRAGDPIAEINTEKATHELVAPQDGILHPIAAAGTNLQVEALIGYVLAKGESAPLPSLESPAPTETIHVARGPTSEVPAHPLSAIPREVRATPVARRLAAHHKIELAGIPSSGPGGRIVEADVVAAISRSKELLSAPDSPIARVRERLPLSPMRRAIAERLKKSAAAAVSLTLTREVRADALVTARKRLAEMIGATPSFDALFVKLLAVALREHPELNVALEDETLVYFEDVHIGFAVAVPAGVVVPVIRHADSGSLRGIHSSIVDLSKRALQGALRSEDIQGGTATLTNLGGHGIDAFTPVLNPPQAAILGIGRIVERACVDKGILVPAHTCVLSLTFDHRVADGVPAAQLLDSIARRLGDADYLASLAAL